jgi:hypothetical protein
MAYDEPDDDEDWYDDDDAPEDDEPGRCPECGEPVPSIASMCPACGYWLSDADRRALWTSESKPAWLRVTAIVVLITFLASLLACGVWLF